MHCAESANESPNWVRRQRGYTRGGPAAEWCSWFTYWRSYCRKWPWFYNSPIRPYLPRGGLNWIWCGRKWTLAVYFHLGGIEFDPSPSSPPHPTFSRNLVERRIGFNCECTSMLGKRHAWVLHVRRSIELVSLFQIFREHFSGKKVYIERVSARYST